MPHRLSEIIAFGERLIKTEDLDPVYVALVKAKLPKAQLHRLLLAYFCFYQLGAAAYLSEQDGEVFWNGMKTAAANGVPPKSFDGLSAERWPRGAERRHFRGKVCIAAVKEIERYSEGKSGPETFVGVLLDVNRMSDFTGLLKAVQAFPLFGPWISFKVADVLERVCGAGIEFPNDLTLLYKEPRAALDMLDVPAEKANAKLLEHFYEFDAPPRYERQCNIQEVETILCKWKSSVGGHYWIGKDIHEIRKGLAGWGETANKLLKVMPKEVEQGLFK